MSLGDVLLLLLCLAGMLAMVVLGLVAMLPSISKATERARVEREVQEASWRIHQQATRAFGQLLTTARDADVQELDQ